MSALKRDIGLWSATAIGVGAIIGAGIFVVTGVAAGAAGPAIIVSMIITGVVAAFTALSFSELSAALPQEGGAYIFARELISPYVGFIAGWMWIFSNIFTGAAVSLGFAHYFGTVFSQLPVKAVAVAICLVFILLNYFGVRHSTTLNNVLVLVKIAILVFFVALGVGYLNFNNFTPFAPKGFSGVLEGSSLIFFAYAGFARIAIMAEEVKDPRHTIPRSIALSLGISMIIYLLVSFVGIGLVGYVDLSSTGSPLAVAIHVTGNHYAVFLVSVGAMVATASVLLTTILGVSRVTFAMARENDLPNLLSKIHSQYKTPYVAIWISGTLMIVAAVFADLNQVIAISNFASLLYYSIANVSASRLNGKIRRYPSLVPVVGLFSCLSLLVFLKLDGWVVGMIGVGLGTVYYRIFHRR